MKKTSTNFLRVLGFAILANAVFVSDPAIAALAQVSTLENFTNPPKETVWAEIFLWPEINEITISDRRISAIVNDAKSAAKDAKSRSVDAKRYASQAKNRGWLQRSVGIKPVVAAVDDDTEITASRGLVNGIELGSITYPTGATMIGAFGPDLGIYTGRTDSQLSQFTGWVWGASRSNATPIEGRFEWKNGDIFTGLISGDGSRGTGIYHTAGGELRFIGIIDFSQQPFQPVAGIVESKSGRLLAVLLEQP